MTNAPGDPAAPDAVLRRSWSLFKHNTIIALPLFLIFVVFVVIVAVMAEGLVQGHFFATVGPRPNFPPWFWPWFLAAEFGSVVAMIVVLAAVYGMADAAWQHGTASLRDGVRAVRTRAGAIFVALIGYAGVGIAVVILALPTLGLVFLAWALFTMYVLPAVIAGNRGGFAAFGESYRLVRRNLGASAITLVVLFAIQYGISFLALPAILPLQLSIMMSAQSGNAGLPHFELWQLIVAGVGYTIVIGLTYLYMGFGALVKTGLYRELRARDAVTTAS